MRQFRVVSSLAVGIFVWALVFAGCSGSSTVTITLSPASGVSLNPGATQTITATLTNDKNNQGVTWTLSGPGQLSSNTTTSVVYTAPADISTAATATVTATSIANSTITATESITLNAVLTIATTSLPAGTLQTSYNTFVAAEGATGTFTWSVTAGSLPPGLTFQSSSTSASAEITGIPIVLGTYKFTVQVTDSSSTSVTQALSITINPEPPLSVATASLPSGQVGTPYNPNNQISLQASSGTPPYSWALINGTTLPIGLTLTSTGVISGTPIATGTSNFTVQVTDSTTPTPQTATGNLSITVSQGNTVNSKLMGNYAFMVSGFDSAGPLLPLFAAAGSFVADGAGNIIGGLMDINDTAHDPRNPTFTGTYSIGQNGVGFMTLNSTDTITPTRRFALSMMANGNANIIEFDDTTGGFINASARNSGVLLKQDTSAFTGAPVGATYAFGFSGIDSSQNRYGVAGSFTSDGNGGLTGISLDSDDAGTTSSQSGLSGTSTAVDSNGRGTITINTAIYSFYVVSATQMLVIGIDTFAPGGNPLVGGTILQQSCSGCFTNASLSAPSAFEITALNGSTAESQVGVFTGGTGFSLISDQNSGGTLTQPSGSGTYSVAANGRVSVTANLTTGSGFQNTTPTGPQPVFYLVTTNQAFIIGTDSAVSFGFMTAQSGLPFTAASLSGTYAGGSLAPVDPSVSNVISIAVAGSGALNITANESGPNGLNQSQIATTTAVATSGRVVVQENQNTVEILYMVAPQEFFALDAAAGDTTARVDIFQQ